METKNDFFSRSEALLGAQAMEALRTKRVILFGVGGVGSWCAEALVRTGLTHLTIVDDDIVQPSNINRQLPATQATLGRPKVEALRERLLEINPEAEIILIHDGARPLVSETVIRAAVDGAKKYGAALPAVAVTDTIKTCENSFVISTQDRNKLFAAQTPQAFQSELIKAALSDAIEKGLELTDDCAAVERLGMKVRIVEGDSLNRKITVPADLTIAEALMLTRLTQEK